MSSIAQPWPQQGLPLFEIDFDRFIGEVQAQVQMMRTLRDQPPLVPDNLFLIGQESLPNLVSAPAIAIVPVGYRIAHARKLDDSNLDPTQLFSQWVQLECHCWGDDDPEGIGPGPGSQLRSFSTATELARQLVVAFCDNNHGPAHVRVESARFEQKTDLNRQGRMLVLDIEVESWLVRDAPIQLPIAGPGGVPPGVSTKVSVSGQSQDGTSTVQQALYVVP